MLDPLKHLSVEDPRSGDPERRSDAQLVALREFHAEVDERAAGLAGRHRERLQCRRGCSSCCVDGLAVFDVEAERIRRSHPALLRDGVPHPSGACAFLDGEGSCRIYPDRPYVCRTQGLPLRWFEESGGGSVVERRDICPLNDTGTPLEELPDADCWLLGPAEGSLAELAGNGSDTRERSPRVPERVPLRSLFRRASS